MKYIAVLDYAHLDNGVFLNSIAGALAQQHDVRPIIIHGESEYTERLIQTGIPRQEASVRCIKDLNRRLVALFADHRVATIGLNGYQRNFITLKNEKLNMDLDYFHSLPSEPVLLLSNLVLNSDTGQPESIQLGKYLNFLTHKISTDEIFLFSKEEFKNMDLKASELVPDDLKNLEIPVRITTSLLFGNIPDLGGSKVFNKEK